jgi:DNA-binding LacI/PurR family transcriptional regulator
MSVRLKDIAEQIGCTAATVSMALRGDLRISSAKRTLIQAAAQKLGYRPNPILSALSSFRSKKTKIYQSSIAWLTDWPLPGEWKKRKTFSDYYSGAQEQAHELGFRLEPIWLREKGPIKTASILLHRGVQGILVAPLPPNQENLEFNFDDFVAVHVGRSLHHPPLPSVAHNHYQALLTTFDHCQKNKFHRIGFIMNEPHDRVSRFRWSAAYLALQYRLPPEFQRLPIYHPEEFNRFSFRKWLRANRPDCIITNIPGMEASFKILQSEMKHRIPLFSLVLDEQKEVPGIFLNAPEIGRQAMNYLYSRIIRFHRGIPDHKIDLEIEGIWHSI